MKKLLITTLVIASSLSPVKAQADVVDYLKKYGLPCAASLLGGLALADSSKNGMAIGVGACLGIGTATFINDQMQKDRQLSEVEIAKIQSVIGAKTAEMDAKMKAIEEAQKAQIEDMRSVIREVIADRMLKMEDTLRLDVQKKLETGEFMPQLEKNLSSAIKREVVAENKARQKELVEKCVELTIKEVVAKPIGLPENSSGISEDDPVQEQ